MSSTSTFIKLDDENKARVTITGSKETGIQINK